MSEQSVQLPAHEKRYGNIAVENGFITPLQLVEALNTQILEEINDGNHRHIGLILFDMNYITLEQDREVLDELARE